METESFNLSDVVYYPVHLTAKQKEKIDLASRKNRIHRLHIKKADYENPINARIPITKDDQRRADEAKSKEKGVVVNVLPAKIEDKTHDVANAILKVVDEYRENPEVSMPELVRYLKKHIKVRPISDSPPRDSYSDVETQPDETSSLLDE